MKIFISWSGEASQKVARALHAWLPTVIQRAEPFFSTTDIRSGEQWLREISGRLESSSFAILCLTKDALTSPWLLFEAGAVSKQTDSRVVPLYIGVADHDVVFPLAMFQGKKAEKADMLALVEDINRAQESPLSEALLHKTFDAFWPEFDKELKEAITLGVKSTASKPKRSAEDMASETLDTVRALSRKLEAIHASLGSHTLDGIIPGTATVTRGSAYTIGDFAREHGIGGVRGIGNSIASIPDPKITGGK